MWYQNLIWPVLGAVYISYEIVSFVGDLEYQIEISLFGVFLMGYITGGMHQHNMDKYKD